MPRLCLPFRHFSVAACSCALLWAAPTALAQTATVPQETAKRPYAAGSRDAQRPRTREEARQRNEARRAEREAQMAARRAAFEKRVREMLTNFGFPETATQDAIIAYMISEEQAKNAQRRVARRLVFALHGDVPPARLVELVTEFKKAREENETRATQSLAELDAKTGFSTNPRLEAVLLISGILGGEGIRLEMLAPRKPPRRENAERENVKSDATEREEEPANLKDSQ